MECATFVCTIAGSLLKCGSEYVLWPQLPLLDMAWKTGRLETFNTRCGSWWCDCGPRDALTLWPSVVFNISPVPQPCAQGDTSTNTMEAIRSFFISLKYISFAGVKQRQIDSLYWDRIESVTGDPEPAVDCGRAVSWGWLVGLLGERPAFRG